MRNSGIACIAVTRAPTAFASSMPRWTARSESFEPSVGSRMCLNMAPSVRFAEAVRRHGQRDDFDSFVAQRFDFLRARGAADVALGRFAIVDLARLFGKGPSDVFGVLEHFFDDVGEQLGAEIR